jgi:hypothetical protein
VISNCKGWAVIRTSVDDTGIGHYIEAAAAIWPVCDKIYASARGDSAAESPAQPVIWPVMTKYGGFTTHVRLETPNLCGLPGFKRRKGVWEQVDLESKFNKLVQHNIPLKEARRFAAIAPFVNQTKSVANLFYSRVRPLGVDFCGLLIDGEAGNQDNVVTLLGIAGRKFKVRRLDRSVECESRNGYRWRYQEIWDNNLQRHTIKVDIATEPHIVELRWCLEAAFRYPFMGNAALYFMMRFATGLRDQRIRILDKQPERHIAPAIIALDDFFKDLLSRLFIFDLLKKKDPDLKGGPPGMVVVSEFSDQNVAQQSVQLTVYNEVGNEHVAQLQAQFAANGVIIADAKSVLGDDAPEEDIAGAKA